MKQTFNLYINGLARTDVSNESTKFIWHNKNMYNDSILIEENTLAYDDDKTGQPKIDTYISVKYINTVAGIPLDASEFILYWGQMLSPIQIRRIVFDIFDLYKELPLEEYIQAMYDLSTQSVSSSTQSKKDSGTDIINRIQSSFNEIASFYKSKI